MTGPAIEPDRRFSRLTAVAGLGIGLLALMVAGLLSGAVAIGPTDLFHMIGRRLGLTDDAERLTDSVLWAIRLPRVLSGAVVGAGLAVAGTALQGTFRNQMADPSPGRHLAGGRPRRRGRNRPHSGRRHTHLS